MSLVKRLGVVLLVATATTGACAQSAYPPPGNLSPQSQGNTSVSPRGGNLADRFAAANVSHDGRLTIDQAQAAGWRRVARYFAEMDTGHKGYLTIGDIRTWKIAHRQAPGAQSVSPG